MEIFIFRPFPKKNKIYKTARKILKLLLGIKIN
jgi:hypothetical protein